MWSKKNKKQILVFSEQINIDNNAKKKKKSFDEKQHKNKRER